MADYARRHYTALAKILSASRMQALEVVQNTPLMADGRPWPVQQYHRQGRLDAYTEIESQLVTLFQADNARFNADRFRAAAAAGGAE